MAEAWSYPQPGAGPATPGDYEASDQTLVFATAALLSQQAGLYSSKLLGSAGFAKLDVHLSSPMTTYGISDNGIEHVETETATTSLTSTLSLKLVSHFRAQFSRDWQWSESNSNTPRCQHPRRLWPLHHPAPRNPRAPTSPKPSAVIFDPIKVDPFTFQALIGGRALTPLRAYAIRSRTTTSNAWDRL
jgi:hypothetical protein